MSKVEHLQAVVTCDQTVDRDYQLEPFTFGAFTFTALGLTVKGVPQQDEWTEVGRVLAVQVRGIQFQVGDWANIGEAHFGELAAQVIDARTWDESTVKVYRWVADRVPFENRVEGLTFSHHMAVAALNAREQRQWLKQATGNGDGPWPVGRLKAAVRDGSDLAPSGWFIMVTCKDEAEQQALVKKLELEGRQCRALERRGKAKS